MRKLDMVVHMATKLNRSHLLLAKHSYLFPVLGRTEIDQQQSGAQSVTVEDSMSMVHASRGTLDPASPHLEIRTRAHRGPGQSHVAGHGRGLGHVDRRLQPDS